MPRLIRLLVARGRTVPWVLVFDLARRIVREGRRRWDRLSPGDQRELTRILRKSRGRPSRVSAGERAEARRIVLKALGIGR